ncbi:MAG: hypothetical protein JWM47_1947 [Acidimicrobiales bacterium]|nr:hypothetical protein [Acidimicrobiales bacterium]
MIHLVDQALEAFLREAVPLPSSRIDVSFAAPDKSWGAGLNRPTVNCFLWDVSRDPKLALTGVQQRDAEGGVERRHAPVRVVLGYVITAWATEERDRHQLLGSVMQAILSARHLPASFIPEALNESTPLRLDLGDRDERGAGEFWSALGGQLQAGLSLKVSMAVEIEPWTPAAAAASSVELMVNDGLGAGHAAQSDAASGPARPPVTRVRRHGAVVAERPPES